MAVYDGSFNTRFNLAVLGKKPRGSRGSKGGVRRAAASFGISPARLRRSPKCAKPN
jgi:hypothetical protein